MSMTPACQPGVWGRDRRILGSSKPASLMWREETVSNTERTATRGCHDLYAWITALACLYSHKHANTLTPRNGSLLLIRYEPTFSLELTFEFLSSSLLFTILTTNLPDRTVKCFLKQSAVSANKSVPFYFIGLFLARETNPPAPTLNTFCLSAKQQSFGSFSPNYPWKLQLLPFFFWTPFLFNLNVFFDNSLHV